MALPPDILQACVRGDGSLVFISGAGCSVEAPTSLPPSGECARRAHDRLVNDGLLQANDCDDPTNLEALADKVVERTGGKQELVRRLPKNHFRTATPNVGHRVAVALRAYHAVGNGLTINFDLAFSTALSQAGVDEVKILNGPEDHGDLGNMNLIYLHRNANANEESWILTSEEVREGWDTGWEPVMAARVLASPVIVFVGIGTTVAVLHDTLARVRAAVPDHVHVFHVDPIPRDECAVFAALHLPDEHYIESGWVTFALELGDHLNQEHIRQLTEACVQVVDTNGWEAQPVTEVTSELLHLRLLGFGGVRAVWFLHHGEYLAWRSMMPTWIAELVLGLDILRSRLGAELRFGRDGEVDILVGGRVLTSIGCIHGRGHLRWAALDSQVNTLHLSAWVGRPAVQTFLVAGVQGTQPTDFTTPFDITGGRPEANIIDGSNTPSYMSVDMVRAGTAPEIRAHLNL